MASKSGQPTKTESPEELLEIAGQALDRLRVMYEQYFLGMQKQAPGVLHSEVERRLRDLQQSNLRNTKMRYQFATMQQKFGSYNAYWKRTLRQIENGTYMRSLAKIGRNAVQTGKDIPEEILAAMPKMMREQVQRDRALAIAKAKRDKDAKRKKRGEAAEPDAETPPTDAELLELGGELDDLGGLGPEHYEAPMELSPHELADVVAMINEPSELRRSLKSQRGPHVLQESDGELDIDSFFAAVEAAEPAPQAPKAVNFRSVTRSSAQIVPPPVEPPPDHLDSDFVMSFGAPPAPAGPPRPTQRPSQPIPAQAQAGPPRPSQQMQAQPGPPAPPTQRPSQPMAAQPTQPPQRPSQPMPAQRPSQPMPAQPGPPPQRQSQPMAAQPGQRPSQPIPAVTPPNLATQTSPAPRPNLATQTSPAPRPPPPQPALPAIPPRRAPTVPPPIPAPGARPAPSQAVKPNPIAPGSAATARPPVPVPPQPQPRPAAPAAPPRAAAPPPRPRSDTDPEPPRAAARPLGPPPGMTDADVNALHAQYRKAKAMVGQDAGAGSRDKLLKTINEQAPKIMEQYKAQGVDFQVVVKDNQVIIRAKPKP